MRSNADTILGRFVPALPFPSRRSSQTVYECRRCGSTLEGREEDCDDCEPTTRVAVFRID